MDNFLHKYFNNRNEQALQVDEDGLYNNYVSYQYKYYYVKLNERGNFDDTSYTRTEWVDFSPREFILHKKANGIKITILDKSKRVKKEAEPF